MPFAVLLCISGFVQGWLLASSRAQSREIAKLLQMVRERLERMEP